MLRPRNPLNPSFSTLKILISPALPLQIRCKTASKMYKGTAPKKLKKPSPPPTRLSQGVKKTQKPSYKRPTKDPLQGLRESKEEEKMIKFQPKPVEEQNPVKPVLDRKHGLQKKPVPGIEKKQENSTELEEETPIERDLPRQEKIPSNASSPDPMEMSPPTSTRRPIPP